MQIEELWIQLEADAASGKTGAGGWLLRLARPATDCLLFVGVELASGRRAILLALPTGSISARRLWPRSKGLEPLAVTIGGRTHFGVALKEKRFADVFTALTEDLIRRVAEAGNVTEQGRVFIGQLARWQKFLSATFEGLSEEGQRGLWGELYFLREHLFPALGVMAVNGWKGGERAHQDFQFRGGAVEVKTTVAKLPQIVRITSERQLDASTLSTLFLNVIALEIRDGRGETLPSMVASLRSGLTGDTAAQEQFEDELILAGYLDVHAVRYLERRYAVRSDALSRVRPKFPCLIEADMPTGVGDANYALSVAACEPFKVSTADVSALLASLEGLKCKGGRRA